MATVTAVRFSVLIGEAWDEFDNITAVKHGVEFLSETGSNADCEVVATFAAPDLATAEAFVTEMFSCDEDCTAEELMDII
jgi:hypothetical protein